MPGDPGSPDPNAPANRIARWFWNASEPAPSRRRAPWRWLLTTALLTALVAFSTLGQLADLLAGMDPGVIQTETLIDMDLSEELERYFAQDLSIERVEAAERVEGNLEFWRAYVPSPGADLNPMPWDSDRSDMLTTWEVWRVATERARSGDAPLATPWGVVRWHVAIDSLLVVPSVVVILGFSFAALRRRRVGLGHAARHPGLRALDNWMWLLPVFAVADIAENLLTLAIFQADPTWLEALASLTTVVKWAAVLGAVGALTYYALAIRRLRLLTRGAGGDAARRGSYARGFVALRVPIVILVVLAAAMLGVLPSGVGDQFPDTIRRWTWGHLVITVGLALWLAFLVWALARHLRMRTVHRPSRHPGKEPWPTIRQWVVRAIVGLAALQLVLYLVWRFGVGRESMGLGLLVPGALVVSLAAVGFFLPEVDVDEDLGRRIRPFIPERAPRLLAATTLAVVGLAVIRTTLPHLFFFGKVRWWLIGIVAYVALVIFASGSVRAAAGAERAPLVGSLATLVAAVPIALLGLALLDGADESVGLRTLTIVGFALYYTALPAYHLLGEQTAGGAPHPWVNDLLDKHRWRAGAKWLFAAVGILGSVAAVALAMRPFPLAAWVGATGILMVFVILFATVVHLVSVFVEHTDPPRLLFHVGLRRTPVLALTVVWLLAVTSFDVFRADDYHDVRIAAQGDLATVVAAGEVGERGPAPSPVSLEAAYARWKRVNGIGTRTGPTPMVIVSAWGGGVRAADWTALVMDRAFDEKPEEWRSDHIVAASGISGGTLGLLEFVAHLTDRQLGGGENDWVREHIGDEDFLAPPLSQLLFVDIPLSFAGYVPGVQDRGDVIERAWQQPWDRTVGGEDVNLLEQGLLALWENPRAPVVISNGASIAARCLLNASALDASIEWIRDDDHDGDPTTIDDCTSLAFMTAQPGTEPGGPPAMVGTRDLGDFLWAGEDVRLSTAALLSSRFTYISPTGRLVLDPDRCPEGGTCDREEHEAYILDGGYAELSGALTAFQVWDALEPLVAADNADQPEACIVPFMIHIENGFDVPAPQDADPAAPNEWTDPASAASIRGSVLSRNARARAAFEFGPTAVLQAGPGALAVTIDDAPATRYAFLTTRVRLGTDVPLGWTLSQESHENLVAQVDFNDAQFALIDSWFDGELECTVEAP